MTLPDDRRQRRFRAHTFAGGAAAVIAVGAIPLFGWAAGIAMALLALGNLLAARGVKAHDEAGPTAWALIAVGGLGFLATVVLLILRVATRSS